MSPNPDSEVRQSARTILFTDIVGSSQFFVAEGNTAGVEMIKRHNQYLFPIIESANGQVIKTIGDSILAVFEHPSEALQAAFTMQSRLAEVRRSQSSDKNLHIRIGIHYGLVRELSNDVFGDAVNIADRVKSTAAPDQILISRTLRDLIKVYRRFTLQSAGVHILKGSPEPMELFELTEAPAVQETSFPARMRKRAVRTLRRRSIFVIAGFVLILAALLAGHFWLARPEAANTNTIAVLPFRNLNNDTETDYLSIAFAAELNAQLLKVESIVVRPLSAVVAYKGQNWDPQKVAQRLQVAKIINGSFISANGQLRVNVEIIDVAANKQLPLEPYQGKITDTLNMLDQTARKVANTLRLRILENTPIFQYGTDNIQAYDEYLRGFGKVSAENDEISIRSFETAVALDAKFARAHAALAEAYTTHFWWNFSNDTGWLDKAEQSARKSLALDANLIEGHYSLAYTLEAKGQRADAIREYMKCFRLNPRYISALTYLARYAFYMGEFDLALSVLERIARIDPTSNIHMRRAINLFFAGRLEECRQANNRAEKLAESVDELTLIGMTYAWLKDRESVERMRDKLKTIDPKASSIAELNAWIATLQNDFPKAQSEMAHFSERKSWGIMQEMAALYALQGEKENSLNWLEKAVASGGPSYVWFKSDQFAILKGNPLYETIIQKLAAEYDPLRAEFRQLLGESTFR